MDIFIKYVFMGNCISRKTKIFRGEIFESPLFYVRDDIIAYGKLEMDSSNGRPFER